VTAEELLDKVEALGVTVTLDRGGVLLRPGSRLTPELIEALRACKDELRALIELRAWPEASREAVRRFGAPHARLYPFLGSTVSTPAGPGTLLQVFSERAAVLFTSDGERRIGYFLPSELAPPSGGTAPTHLGEIPVQ
jgi:hypothetical protein